MEETYIILQLFDIILSYYYLSGSSYLVGTGDHIEFKFMFIHSHQT